MSIKHIITLLLLFLPLVVTSQEIKILSFTPDDSDVTANLAGTTSDYMNFSFQLFR